MVKIGPPGPAANTLDVLDEWTYGGTSVETLRVIRFFVEELIPVDIGDFEPEDRWCDICTAELAEGPHHAVRLPCTHILGRECIERWLRPFASTEEIEPTLGATTCPVCRRVFLPAHTAFDTLHFMEARIRFWDWAYACVGIALTETERQARADLLQHVKKCYARGEEVPFVTEKSVYTDWVHMRLQIFCHDLKGQTLTPVQEHLRQGLDQIAMRGLDLRLSAKDGVRCWRDDQGDLVFGTEHALDTVQSGGNDERGERDDTGEKVNAEGESDVLLDVLLDGDTEEMRFFRAESTPPPMSKENIEKG
ncbi:hypothetical protein MMC07_008161 [Pseudocyphellaria aurata]|nr:hypothetical protein [Pseudocyphellaria aurata]